MKYGIITVYNSENCGSFLQAYAMSCAIKNLGNEAVFIRQGFKGHSSTLPVHLTNVVKSLLRGNFSGAKLLRARRLAFKHACKSYFPTLDASKKVDCLVLGSDVIWDLTVPYFRNNREFFWGTAFGDTKVISYAPALGFAKEKELEKDSFVSDALSGMSAISVRDKTTKQLLEPYSDKEIQLVCDPTYLIDRKEYDAIATPTELNKFIFLYCYQKLSKADISSLKALAEKEGLKTVSFGSANNWCDMNLAFDPLLFLSLFEKADYVITDGFHGTVFSTIYEKRFAVIKSDSPKVLDLLELCEMSDKMTKPDEDISVILHSDFDYETTRKKIKEERDKSLHYLKGALEGLSENG